MKIYDLSKEIMSTRPFEGDPAPVMTRLANMSEDGYNLSTIAMSLNSATHVDAPLHFIKRGKDVAGLPLDIFVGDCTVMTVPGRRLDAMYFMRYPVPERLLLRGGGELTESGIGFLYNNGLRLIGTDRESIGSPTDERSVHAALLGYNIAILENLNLTGVPDGRYTLCAAPLRIKGAEAAPCRALLLDLTEASEAPPGADIAKS